MPTVFNDREVKRLIALAPALPLNPDRTEVRIMAAVITLGFVAHSLKSAYYLLMVGVGPLARVVRDSPIPTGCIAALFVLAALATLPHVVSLTFMPRTLACKFPRRAAAYSALGIAVAWLYLANRAYPMHLGGVWAVYLCNMLGCVVVSMTYGFSVNAQQLRERLSDDQAAN